VQQTDQQRDTAISYALDMLDCNTKLMNASTIKGYSWYVHSYFPFTAYMHIVQDLKRRPLSDLSELAWETMGGNFEAKFTFPGTGDNPFFKMFVNMIFGAWAAREAALREANKDTSPPYIVTSLRQKVAAGSRTSHHYHGEQAKYVLNANLDASVSMPTQSSDNVLLHDMGGLGFAGTGTGTYHDVSDQIPENTGLNEMDWAPIDWNIMPGPSW
jgi:hypothetical protein